MEEKQKSNIVLIGMPGAGKSTVGQILAKETALKFIDTDNLIEERENRTLQEILEAEDYLKLRKIEESTLLDLNVQKHVIATGGSAAYSSKAMAHLNQNSIIVFLDVDFVTLEARIDNIETRGLAKSNDQTLADIYQERFPLYEKYSDVRIDATALSKQDVAQKIIDALETQ